MESTVDLAANSRALAKGTLLMLTVIAAKLLILAMAAVALALIKSL